MRYTNSLLLTYLLTYLRAVYSQCLHAANKTLRALYSQCLHAANKTLRAVYSQCLHAGRSCIHQRSACQRPPGSWHTCEMKTAACVAQTDHDKHICNINHTSCPKNSQKSEQSTIYCCWSNLPLHLWMTGEINGSWLLSSTRPNYVHTTAQIHRYCLKIHPKMCHKIILRQKLWCYDIS